MEEIRLGMENFGSFLDDIECMLLFYPSLPAEMILKIIDVRLALLRFGKELLIGRDDHCWGLNLKPHYATRTSNVLSVSKTVDIGQGVVLKDLFDDSLLCVDD